MLIFIRTLQGEEFQLEVEPNDTIRTVKRKLQDKVGIRIDLQRLVFQNGSLHNDRTLSSYGIGEQSVFQLVLQSSNVVAGGYGLGSSTKELCFPYGIAVDDNQTICIADWGNHRIVQWRKGDTNGQVIAGGHGQGNQSNQLNNPTDVLIDKETNSIIICDRGNKRIVRWSRRDGTTEGEILLEDIACWGLAMDNQRYLYISDTEKHEVKRYQIGDKNGTIVAGGYGRGASFKHLNEPTYVFVDQQQTVYISDTWNFRVMKWIKDAKEGVDVVRGFPRGLFVDTSETIYVADYGNHGLMRWPKGAAQGTVIAGGNRQREEEASQRYYPWGLCFDHCGHFFVTDHSDHKIQCFPLPPAN